MGAGRDLGAGEGDAHLDEPVEETLQPFGAVVDVEQEVRVPAQDRREREGPLDPAHDGHVVADVRAQEAHSLQPVAHAPAVLGRDELQPGLVLRGL